MAVTGSAMKQEGAHIEVEVESMEVFRRKYNYELTITRVADVKCEVESSEEEDLGDTSEHEMVADADIKSEPNDIFYNDESHNDYINASSTRTQEMSDEEMAEHDIDVLPGTSRQWDDITNIKDKLMYGSETSVYVEEYQDDNKSPFECNTCLKKFTTFHSLKQHGIVHSRQKPFKCDECGKTFARKGDLQRHKSIHTGVKPHECNICFKTFRESSKLKNHLVSHSGEKAFQCDTCFKKFTLATNLMKHKLIHAGIKPFECDVCQRRFRQLSCLVTHKFLHTGEKPFQCEVCLARFTQSSSLMKHKLTHSGEKPYECDVCHRRFRQTSSLRVHMLTHSEDRPFHCDMCKRSFKQASNLSRHLLSHKESTQDGEMQQLDEDKVKIESNQSNSSLKCKIN